MPQKKDVANINLAWFDCPHHATPEPQMTKDNLNKILKAHKDWIERGFTGEGRADLSYSDLRGSDLLGSNLSYSDLRGSDLRGSDLRGSNLSYSDLRDSDLNGSNLRGGNLRDSNLSDSNLSYSDLRGSNLSYSDLRGSDLLGSNLSYSDLSYSDLRGAKNFVLLPVQDPRGHSFPNAVWHGDQWMIRSGCKCLSIADALAYVTSTSFSGERWLSEAYVHAFGWLTAWAAVRCELGAQQ